MKKTPGEFLNKIKEIPQEFHQSFYILNYKFYIKKKSGINHFFS